MGVWIETFHRKGSPKLCGSLPSWECGLKRKVENHRVLYAVTPLVGVWIETLLSTLQRYGNLVTPLVGVWIETEAQ